MKHKGLTICVMLALVLVLLLAPAGPVGAQEPTPDSTFEGAPELAAALEFSSMPCTGGETVLLIQDNIPWAYNSNVIELTAQGKNFCIVNSWDIGTTNLAQFGEILISADQGQGFYNNLFPGGVVHPVLTAYVRGGGTLSANLTDWGWNGGQWTGWAFVGGLQHVLSYQQDLSIADPVHPVIANALPCPSGNCGQIVDAGYRNDLDDWNYSTHGYFTNLPPATGTILVDGAGRRPRPTRAHWRLTLRAREQKRADDLPALQVVVHTLLHPLSHPSPDVQRVLVSTRFPEPNK